MCECDGVPSGGPRGYTGGMTPRIREILAEYRQRLEAIYGPRLKRLVLFGSQARGDAEPDSDIDVMIVLEGPLDRWAEVQRCGAMNSELCLKHDAVICRVFATPEQLERRNRAFYEEVRREGIAF
jgi:predicted nucleotidyltransferase